MKNIFLKLFIFTIIFFWYNKLKAEFPMNELLIYNYSGQPLYLKFYPISGLYNSKKTGHIETTEYTYWSHLYNSIEPESGAIRKGDGPPLKTIVGLDGVALYHPDPTYDGFFNLSNNQTCEFSVDYSPSGEQDDLIGFGIYKLEIYKDSSSVLVPICNPITIDWSDFNSLSSNYLGKQDLLIFVRGFDTSDIKYLWTGGPNTPPSEEVAFEPMLVFQKICMNNFV